MIYLDNAATSYPKPEQVYREIDRCMREYCANPGRGGHAMSIECGKAVLMARENISRYFGIKNPMRLCFSKNATEALNIAVKGILNKGGHAITSSMEHNSVIRPLKTLEKYNSLELSLVRCDACGMIDIEEIRKSIRKDTKLIICTLSSNVNGIIMPVKEIGKIARQFGIPFLVDASQGAGTLKPDVEEMNIDIMAFPGHKDLYGPQGIGGIYVKEGLSLEPIMQGGTGSNSEYLYQPEEMPDLLESGTVNTPGIVGLGSGIDFLSSVGNKEIRNHKQALISHMIEGLKEINNLKIYSTDSIESNSGIIAVNFDSVESNEVSYVLDKAYNIATRAGLHCAPIAHETLGTLKTGIVRFSIGHFNTIEEIDLTLDALREISVNL
ncbi:MAG TPA: aminotransferase class V-fold PLP-dependent enzyme [Clostridia bacterium]|nr:aminotransferase class V-fold PLP-dependent enzyme [Clostridia bacterium]